MCRGVEAASRPCVEPCVEPDVEDVEARAQVDTIPYGCDSDLCRIWRLKTKPHEGAQPGAHHGPLALLPRDADALTSHVLP